MTLEEFLAEWDSPSGTIQVQTSGSTGEPKLLTVEKTKMMASAKMTCDFLHISAGASALLCMSLQHIGAKMMVVRSLVGKLRLIATEPCGHPLANLTETPDFAAMVPLQVYNSLQNAEEKERLRNIKNLIIGGGGIQPHLQAALKDFPYAVWSTYGMTETLSHIALRRLNGPQASLWYTPFEGIKLRLDGEQCLCINAPMLCNGELKTNDVAEINSKGQFRIIGRKDNTINSGGIKIQAEEVEKALQIPSAPDIAIGKLPDEKFGQIVVLLATQKGKERINKLIDQIPKYWRPKRIILTDEIPTTCNGKIDRKGVQDIIQKA